MYNIGLISIKKPQNVTLKGFWGRDLLVLLLRDFFCCLYVQQNTCFSFHVMVRKKKCIAHYSYSQSLCLVQEVSLLVKEYWWALQIEPIFRHSKRSRLRGVVKDFKVSTEAAFPESILALDRPPRDLSVPAETMLTRALLKSNHCSIKLDYTLLLRKLKKIQPSYTKKLNRCWSLCLVLFLRCFSFNLRDGCNS